jgi:hypothetical protein
MADKLVPHFADVQGQRLAVNLPRSQPVIRTIQLVPSKEAGKDIIVDSRLRCHLAIR